MRGISIRRSHRIPVIFNFNGNWQQSIAPYNVAPYKPNKPDCLYLVSSVIFVARRPITHHAAPLSLSLFLSLSLPPPPVHVHRLSPWCRVTQLLDRWLVNRTDRSKFEHGHTLCLVLLPTTDLHNHQREERFERFELSATVCDPLSWQSNDATNLDAAKRVTDARLCVSRELPRSNDYLPEKDGRTRTRGRGKDDAWRQRESDGNRPLARSYEVG